MNYSVDQAAKITNYNPENIRQMLRKGIVPGAKKKDVGNTQYVTWVLNDRSIKFLTQRRKRYIHLTTK